MSKSESIDWVNPVHNDNPAPIKSEKGVTGDKVAVILEDRNLTHLMPLMMHFSAVLGPSWPIVLFTSPTATLSASAPFQRAVKDSRILVKYVPADTKLKTSHSVSSFLTKSWFWEQLAPAKHVLLFQADSILCANSPVKVDDFLEYDFVGAPIGAFWGEGFNGGLSLRNRNMILDILKTEDWTKEKEEYGQRVAAWKAELKANGSEVPSMNTIPGTVAVDMEDQWFYQKMKAMGGKFPNQELASTFAVETIYYEYPLGYHQVQRYYGANAERMEHISNWCPEHRLCTNDFIYLHPDGDEPKKEEPASEDATKENSEAKSA